MSHFSLAAFNILPLCVTFECLIIMCLVHFFGFILVGVCWTCWVCPFSSSNLRSLGPLFLHISLCLFVCTSSHSMTPTKYIYIYWFSWWSLVKSLRLSYFTLFFFFSFCPLYSIIQMTCLKVCYIFLLRDWVFCWNSLVNFQI